MSKKSRIGMILDQDFPPDIRVENEAISLIGAGYDVYLLCYNYTSDTIIETDFKGIHLVKIPLSKKWAYRNRALVNTILDWFTPYWKLKIKSFIKNYQIDILHIHDLYLLGAALAVKKIIDIPIVSDLHENYVDGLEHYRFSATFPGNILISINHWRKKERKWVNRADMLITVIEEAVDRYHSLGVPREKIFAVPNYVKVDSFLGTRELDDTIIKKFLGKKVILYVGGFDKHRGLESVIKAMPKIMASAPDTLLVLVGAGSITDDLHQLTIEHSVSESVIFEGYQPLAILPSYIRAATLGLIPHLKTTHTDNTIPHKLFHYMIMGKPTIATDCNPLVRIIKNSNCGKIFRSNDSDDFAEKVLSLLSNEEQLAMMGANAQSALYESYTWQRAEKTLIQAYQKLKGE